jgi:hypothetical protein
VSRNPYQAPTPPQPEPPQTPAVAAWSDPSLDAPPPIRRPIEARQVWRGIFFMLGLHAATVALAFAIALVFGQPSDHGPGADGDPNAIFALGGIFSQFIIGLIALIAGIGGVVARDGGKGAGILIGWVAGIPASLIAGIILSLVLVESYS